MNKTINKELVSKYNELKITDLGITTKQKNGVVKLEDLFSIIRENFPLNEYLYKYSKFEDGVHYIQVSELMDYMVDLNEWLTDEEMNDFQELLDMHNSKYDSNGWLKIHVG
jgi:hypothetical protein